MGFYSRSIFPRLYDRVMDKPHWAKYRTAQLADAHGKILEIGVGTGLNLPHYPEDVHTITTVDPNPGMNRKLAKRVEQCDIKVDERILSGEQLPFDDRTFDTAVSTLTLCSIPNVEQAVQELFRVLKTGGRLLFLEHGLSRDESVARWQRRLNGFQRIFADGCTLTLDVAELLRRVPFQNIECEQFYMEKVPRTHGYMYRGAATK